MVVRNNAEYSNFLFPGTSIRSRTCKEMGERMCEQASSHPYFDYGSIHGSIYGTVNGTIAGSTFVAGSSESSKSKRDREKVQMHFVS